MIFFAVACGVFAIGYILWLVFTQPGGLDFDLSALLGDSDGDTSSSSDD